MGNDDGELRAWMIAAGVILLDVLYARYKRDRECKAIEQATYDREFWELVGKRAPDA